MLLMLINDTSDDNSECRILKSQQLLHCKIMQVIIDLINELNIF